VLISKKRGEVMKMKKILIILCAVVFLFGLSSMALAKVIKVGGIKDTTGATSDVGKDAALGQEEFWSYYVNDHGGINGKKVKYIWFEAIPRPFHQRLIRIRFHMSQILTLPI